MTAGKLGAVVVMLVLAGVFVFLALLSSGPPGMVAGSINAVPNPSATTSYAVTLTFQEYSLLTPSFFGWNEQALVYSAYWSTGAQATQNVIAQNDHVAASVLGSNGDVYTLGYTFTFSIPSQCTTSCASTVLNVTVTAYGLNPMGSLWSNAVGPKCTIVLSSAPAFDSGTTGPGAPPSTEYVGVLAGSLLAATALGLGAVTVARPNVYSGAVAAVAGAGAVVFLVVFGLGFL